MDRNARIAVVAASLPALLAIALCAAAGAGDSRRRLPPGSWGGVGASLEATETGARVEFDCAHGVVSEPITLDGNDSFEAVGTYVREGPGPIRQGDSRGPPARYVGRVSGDELSLTVTETQSGRALGAYTLARGRPARIRKCG
jgi:hypothetical protein